MALTCYRIGATIAGEPVTDPEQILDLEDKDVRRYDPVTFPDFRAWLYVLERFPHLPRWAGLLRSGFGEVEVARSASPGAVLVLSLSQSKLDLFALTFGVGRFLLRDDAYERGYGLRTALNVLYPREDEVQGDLARLRSTDSKRRGPTITRARVQASEASTFETFGVNQLLDVMSAATGVPADGERWGRRISGADFVGLSHDPPFDELGKVCRQVEDAARRTDYREHFEWIDNLQPVTDPWVLQMLERRVIEQLINRELGDLTLAPPDVIDWHRVDGFRYPTDSPNRRSRNGPVLHPDLRLDDLLNALETAGQDIGIAYLRRALIHASDENGEEIHSWPIWRWLVGQVTLATQTYILDEGEFFLISPSYLANLDQFVDGMRKGRAKLPRPKISEKETPYNARVASASQDMVLLDRKNVYLTSRTTPIEICDIATRGRQLIHVKRHFGSSDLSHLFAQGAVSAELLQTSADFRRKAQAQLRAQANGRDGFDYFDDGLRSSNFEIVYAIIGKWSGRPPSQALPFFSKINLRMAVENLTSRSFKVALQPIDVLP